MKESGILNLGRSFVVDLTGRQRQALSPILANSLILLAPHILIRYLSLEAQRTVRSPCPPLDDVFSPLERSYYSNSLQNTNHCKHELH